MFYKEYLAVSPVRFRRMVAGRGCFSRLRIDYEHNVTEDGIKNTRLWRTVLDRAVLDLTGKNTKDKLEVIKWLSLDNKDFLLCCELALLEPDMVFEYMWKIADMLKIGIPKQKT